MSTGEKIWLTTGFVVMIATLVVRALSGTEWSYGTIMADICVIGAELIVFGGLWIMKRVCKVAEANQYQPLFIIFLVVYAVVLIAGAYVHQQTSDWTGAVYLTMLVLGLCVIVSLLYVMYTATKKLEKQ